MRADRLLSLLILLQTRGRMTAQALAGVLEVSERTIYRDIDALTTAGVPVYGAPGREGGYALLEPYRTNLTGMTVGELRALFMLSPPAPLAELGLQRELAGAFLKLSAALPESRRQEEARVRQRFYLDARGWQRSGGLPLLQVLHEAVWEDRRLELHYRPMPKLELKQTVSPYGLVAKAGVWYLVWERSGQVHVTRASELLGARLTGETFTRPQGFDLKGFWQGWCDKQEAQLKDYRVRARVSADLAPALEGYLDQSARAAIEAAAFSNAGELLLELSFPSFEAARARLLACGRGAEVLAPEALRLSIMDFAAQLLARYCELEDKCL